MSKSKFSRHMAVKVLALSAVGVLAAFGLIDPATAGTAMLAGAALTTTTDTTAATDTAATTDTTATADTTGATKDSTGQPDPAAKATDPAAADTKTTSLQTQEVVYEFKLPDGMQLDKAAVDAFVPIAKELKLSPEQAQKFVDLKVKDVQNQVEAWQRQTVQWVDEVRGDAEIGGDNLEKSLAYSKAAMDFIGDPKLKELLDSTGYGNHPTLVRAFVKIGKQLAPDTFVGGKREPAANSEDAALAKMYPTMAKA